MCGCVSGSNTPLTRTVKNQAYLGSLMKRVWAPLTRALNEMYVFSTARTAFRKIENQECRGGVCTWAAVWVVQPVDRPSGVNTLTVCRSPGKPHIRQSPQTIESTSDIFKASQFATE